SLPIGFAELARSLDVPNFDLLDRSLHRMFACLATVALGLGLSLAATAQEPVLLAGSGAPQTALVQQLLALDDTSAPWAAGEGNSVVPIWSGADGHLLAVLAVPGQVGSPLIGGTTSQIGPTSWYLLGATTQDPTGLRWQSNNGFHIDA